MATIYDWQKYMNVLHELALIEYDLRTAASQSDNRTAYVLAGQILYEHFGVDKP